LNGLVYNEKNTDWLLHETEKFFQKRAVFIAILNSIQIIEGNDTKHTEDAIPSLLQEALAVTFDMQVGHDYLEDSDARYDFYNKKEEGIKFDLDLLNRITGGVGLRKSTLTAIASKTGGGKSLMMCHISAATLMQGKNVLYITMEMSEERIAERIDANLFNTPIQNLRSLDKATFDSRVQRIRDKTQGRLVVKEYPTGSAHAGHFRALIEELKAKKNFIPDLVVIDYLNICSSQRIRNSSNANSYTIIKSIAEEIRAIAQEYKFPILTATQLNRGGIDSSDVEMTDTSESIGLVHSLDLYLALIRTEELDQLNQVLVKQLKNRYGDPNMYKRFVVGLDASRMKFYDVEQSAQKNISDSGKQEEDDAPMFDNSKFGKRLKTEGFIF
jgi:predicted ATP-dependent serine protease